MTVIDKGKRGPMTWSIQAFGPWLELVQANEGLRGRNTLMRESLIDTGHIWAGKFLGRRFTNYVRTKPFFYRMGIDGAVRKFRRMGLLQPILAKETDGWDPWSPASPPLSLIQSYRRSHPEAGGTFSRSGNYFTLSRFIRRNSKRIIRDFVQDLMTRKLRPLVETGQAERSAISGYRPDATVTRARAKLTIGIPFGGARNALVGTIVRQLPDAEVDFMQRTWAARVSQRLRKTGLQAFVRGNHQTAPAVGAA